MIMYVRPRWWLAIFCHSRKYNVLFCINFPTYRPVYTVCVCVCASTSMEIVDIEIYKNFVEKEALLFSDSHVHRRLHTVHAKHYIAENFYYVYVKYIF